MDIVRPELTRDRNRRRTRVLAGAVLAVAAVGVGVGQLKPAAPAVDRSLVVIDRVTRGPMLRQVRGSGSLVPVDVNWIAATTEARVARIVTRAGAAVRRDTVILELSDPEQVQRALDARYLLQAAEADLISLRNQLASRALNEKAEAARLKAEFEQARLRANADEELARQGVLPDLTRRLSRNAADELQGRYALESERLRVNAIAARSEIAAQQAKVEQLRALARLLQQQVASLEVRAGIDGVLQQVSVEVGQRVPAGTILAKVVEPSRLLAQLRVPETQARDVALGQQAAIDTRNGLVRGHVMRIDPAAQNATVTIDVGLDAPLPRGARPDLTIDGTIELERIANAVQVGRPVHAQEHATGSVFRVEANHATRVAVKFGKASATTIEVLEGLREGDRIITSDMASWDGFDRVELKE